MSQPSPHFSGNLEISDPYLGLYLDENNVKRSDRDLPNGNQRERNITNLKLQHY